VFLRAASVYRLFGRRAGRGVAGLAVPCLGAQDRAWTVGSYLGHVRRPLITHSLALGEVEGWAFPFWIWGGGNAPGRGRLG
jgi:hypothetical protein